MYDQSAESKASARNALTKISNIFGRAQKPRWIQDFHILLSHSDPNKRYKAGDVIRGEVRIKPTKPTRVTHITIALYGYVQVFKNFNAPGDGFSKESSHTDPGRLLNSPGIVKLFTPIEKTLYGESKLPNRLLRFEFAIALPSHRLPTSIDFERGSISYQVVATITRPTTIGPVLRCEPRRILVNEDIDIAAIPAPKSRAVTLEPIEPRSKQKRRRKQAEAASGALNHNADASSGPSDKAGSEPPSRCHSRAGSRNSFAQSDNASISNCSESIEFRVNSNPSTDGRANCNGSVAGSDKNVRSGNSVNANKLVFASAEVLRGGFLPGDKVPVRIIVTHTKPIKSMCGVIVTLYRKTHIDTQPVLHKAEIDENGHTSIKMITPDIYERSVTGLGGLSLSNSGTSSTYRMDIAQAAVPLIINPATMRADITTHVEVPHESITPTITKVRGQSMDFRYYVEVCLDLQGKLENPRVLPRLTAQPLYGFGKPSAGNSAAVPLSLAAQGTHLIDTQVIRRERPQIVAWQFHVVVGTRDSSRVKQRKQRDGWERGNGPIVPNGISDHHRGENGLSDVQEEWLPDDNFGLGRVITNGMSNFGGSDSVHEIPHGMANGRGWNDSVHDLPAPPTPELTPPPPHPSVPMPEDPVNEKERQRLYEERLMPSAPPIDGPSSSASVPMVPSAPPEDAIDHQYGGRWETEVSVASRGGHYTQHLERARPPLISRPSHGSHTISVQGDGHILCSCGASREPGDHREGPDPHEGHSTHAILHGTASHTHSSNAGSNAGDRSRSTANATDDKQEMERRRLMAERSAPQYDTPDEPAASSSRARAPAPSAPPLGELDSFTGHENSSFVDWDRHEELPRYER